MMFPMNFLFNNCKANIKTALLINKTINKRIVMNESRYRGNTSE